MTAEIARRFARASARDRTTAGACFRTGLVIWTVDLSSELRLVSRHCRAFARDGRVALALVLLVPVTRDLAGEVTIPEPECQRQRQRDRAEEDRERCRDDVGR